MDVRLHPEQLDQLRAARVAVDKAVPTRAANARKVRDWERGLRSTHLYRSADLELVEAVALGPAAAYRDTGNAPAYLGYLVGHATQTVRSAQNALPTAVHHTEPYHAVWIPIGADVGVVHARPEGFADKIVDLLARVDVDFDDAPQFSRRYHVTASDDAALRAWAPAAALERLAACDNLYIEIRGAVMTVTTLLPASPDESVALAKLALDVAAAL